MMGNVEKNKGKEGKLISLFTDVKQEYVFAQLPSCIHFICATYLTQLVHTHTHTFYLTRLFTFGERTPAFYDPPYATSETR